MKMIVTEDYEEMSPSPAIMFWLYHGAAAGESGGDGGEHAKADV